MDENGRVVGWAYGLDDSNELFFYSWTWRTNTGVSILDDDGDETSFVWKIAGKYIAGSQGKLDWTVDADAAVWVQGEFELLPVEDDLDLTQSECSSVNKKGLAMGYGFTEDDTGLAYPQDWYARKK